MDSNYRRLFTRTIEVTGNRSLRRIGESRGVSELERSKR